MELYIILVHFQMNYAPSTVAAAALCFLQGTLPEQLAVWLVGAQELSDVERCFIGMVIALHPQQQVTADTGQYVIAHQPPTYFDTSLWQQLLLQWPTIPVTASHQQSATSSQFQASFFSSSNQDAVDLYQQFENCSIAYPN